MSFPVYISLNKKIFLIHSFEEFNSIEKKEKSNTSKEDNISIKNRMYKYKIVFNVEYRIQNQTFFMGAQVPSSFNTEDVKKLMISNIAVVNVLYMKKNSILNQRSYYLYRDNEICCIQGNEISAYIRSRYALRETDDTNREIKYVDPKKVSIDLAYKGLADKRYTTYFIQTWKMDSKVTLAKAVDEAKAQPAFVLTQSASIPAQKLISTATALPPSVAGSPFVFFNSSENDAFLDSSCTSAADEAFVMNVLKSPRS